MSIIISISIVLNLAEESSDAVPHRKVTQLQLHARPRAVPKYKLHANCSEFVLSLVFFHLKFD